MIDSDHSQVILKIQRYEDANQEKKKQRNQKFQVMLNTLTKSENQNADFQAVQDHLSNTVLMMSEIPLQSYL